jgi:esterase/lipase superfamily enzyme
MEYENYLIHEVLPLMSSRNPTAYLIVTGASFGAYHAMNFALRHPDKTNRVIAMSGMFNVERWLGGYWDDNVYFNCPCLYLPNEYDEGRLNVLLRLDIIMAIGREDPNYENNRWFSGVPGQGHWQRPARVGRLGHDWPVAEDDTIYIGGHD